MTLKADLVEVVSITSLKLHKDTEIFPRMGEEEFSALVEDIKEKGILDPLWVINGNEIIDGRHRFLAAKENKLEAIPVRYCKDKEKSLDIVLSSNMHRRHLSISQRAVIAARMVNSEVGHPNQLSEFRQLTSEQAAKMFGISRDSIMEAKRFLKIEESSEKEKLLNQVMSGQTTVNKALKSLENKEISSAPKKNSPPTPALAPQESKQEPVQEIVEPNTNFSLDLTNIECTTMDKTVLNIQMKKYKLSVNKLIKIINVVGPSLEKKHSLDSILTLISDVF
jgi:ParB/RepB/Spo0J family partition protein